MAQAQSFQNIEETLRGPVLDIIRSEWVLLAQPFSSTGHYVRGLFGADSVRYPGQDGGGLSVALVNLVEYAMAVEEGHSGFHLPSRIRRWPHVSKAGVGYMVVPFRHFTPGNSSATGRAIRQMMPQEIYDRAKRLSSPTRGSFPGSNIERWMHRGNDRLTGLGDLYKQTKSYHYYRATQPNFPAGLLPRAQRQEGQPGYTWKSSPYEGMQRDAQISPNANQGVYSTFRVMTQNSAGWYIPALQGKHFTSQVVENVGESVSDLIAQAAARDLVQHIAVSMSGVGVAVRLS